MTDQEIRIAKKGETKMTLETSMRLFANLVIDRIIEEEKKKLKS